MCRRIVLQNVTAALRSGADDKEVIKRQLDEVFEFEDFKLLFSIGSAAKNAPLVYSVLEVFPRELYSIIKTDVEITIETEEELINNINLISDLLAIVLWTF